MGNGELIMLEFMLWVSGIMAAFAAYFVWEMWQLGKQK